MCSGLMILAMFGSEELSVVGFSFYFWFIILIAYLTVIWILGEKI